jgi:hypothetical protein
MTARNGAITYPVNANRGTYVGSLSIDGTNGQITCHRAYGQSRKWAIWNTYNRAAIIMKAGDSTSNWSYGTNTIRPSNNSSANSLTIFTGLAEELFDLQAIQAINAGANAGNPGRCGIGYNSTTAFSGTSFLGVGTTTNTGSIAAALGASVSRYIAPPALGINTITMLETPGEAVAKTFYGQESSMLLTAQYRG